MDTRKLSYLGEFAMILPSSRPSPNRSTDAYLARHRPFTRRSAGPAGRHLARDHIPMTYITTKDGTGIFYKDWGPRDAQPIVFHHGWPLSADDWDNQMMFFLAKAIA